MDIPEDGTFTNFHFEAPILNVFSLENQKLFAVRTSDAQSLHFYLPKFSNGLSQIPVRAGCPRCRKVGLMLGLFGVRF